MAKQLAIYEEESGRIQDICNRLTADASARVVFLVDKAGQLLASAGQVQGLDMTSLGSLTAGNVVTMAGLAHLIGEAEFPNQYHEGSRESLYMSVVGGRVVLGLVFDNKTSLGLVRLRARKAVEELARVFEQLDQKAATAGPGPLADITDEDIDNLFNE
ncbi:MAG: roadblock/LC7 domain-containing protein [Deltaproteobacteria bacterium]|nr:roadblock/LC7 domain-containing protein [Deltaproteobacteria bacterium]